jgi:D-erythrulose 1-phosphate 3-epimerase
MVSPRIYLAVDNCFASKRWTKPSEWMEIIKEAGLYYVEASADNECDPLYTTSEYIENWSNEIKEYSHKTGVRVANLYSGHGTYATLGLAHNDKSIRDRMLNKWLKKMVKIAINLEAGMGFFCHAFSDSILQDPKVYREAEEELYKGLAELAAYAGDYDKGCLGVEQMYTPHQVPWTILGAEKLIKRVYELSKKAFYITIDTGHQSGQRKFLRPDYGKIKELIRVYKNGDRINNLWLGPKKAYELFYKAVDLSLTDENAIIHNIEQEMDNYPYLFPKYEDGDPYIWLEKLGCYSPIIHLQQTAGNTSSHQPFTQECNRNGIIFGDRFLNALKASYEQKDEDVMPPACEEIYLTLEIFSGTADINEDIIYKLKESVKYWRSFVPVDGLTLDELVKGL